MDLLRQLRRQGGATAEGVWLYSTQVYEFDVEQIEPNVFAPGEHSLVSIGPERNDLDVPWDRAITGGHGKFKHARGQVQQTKIGFNQTECENFTFDFEVRPIPTPVMGLDASTELAGRPRPASCPDLTDGRLAVRGGDDHLSGLHAQSRRL